MTSQNLFPVPIDDATRATIDAISSQMGLHFHERTSLGNRRGSSVVKARSSCGDYAIKLNDKQTASENVFYNPATLIDRESIVLQSLLEYTNNLYAGHGNVNDMRWLLLKWIDGESAGDIRRSIVSNNDALSQKRPLLKLLLSVVEKVSELHKIGFTHGDLQPSHFIIDSINHTHLIDYGLAKGPGLPDFPYKGGLVHYNSPEVAKAILANENVPCDMLTESFSTASVAFYLFTGQTLFSYDAPPQGGATFQDKLKSIAYCKPHRLSDAGIIPCHELEEILSPYLETDREKRSINLDGIIKPLHELIASLKPHNEPTIHRTL